MLLLCVECGVMLILFSRDVLYMCDVLSMNMFDV